MDATTVNSAPFLTYDSENNVYYSELDYINNAHLNIAYLIYDGVSDVDWHRVFDYNELLQDGDFYVDKENRVLYIKSYRDLSGKVFAYGNGAGGLNFKDGSNGLVENIEIVGCGNGVYVNRYSNFVCRGCYIHHVGGIDSTAKDGTPFRYGNGITFWTNDVHNAYAYDNVVFDCFDAGISPQISGSGTKSSDNIKIFNNYVSRCLYTLECFQSLQTAETYDIVIANNLLSDAIDITNGYRHTLSNSNALFRMGTSTSDKTKMFIHDNFGISSYGYAYSFYADSPDGVYDMDDNTLVLVNTNSVEDAIKNPQFYDGSEEDIITIDYGTNEYQQYLQDFYERASAFDISSHYFDIIWSRIISTEEALSEIYDFSSEVDSWENNTEENDLESITVNDSNGSLSDENVSSSDSEEVPATSENQQDSIENNGE